MSAQRLSNTPDLTDRLRGRGPGVGTSYKCGRCNGLRFGLLGTKRVRVLGVICKQCVAAEGGN